MERRYLGYVCRLDQQIGDGTLITDAIIEFVSARPGVRMPTIEVIEGCKAIRNQYEGTARVPAPIEAEITPRAQHRGRGLQEGPPSESAAPDAVVLPRHGAGDIAETVKVQEDQRQTGIDRRHVGIAARARARAGTLPTCLQRGGRMTRDDVREAAESSRRVVEFGEGSTPGTRTQIGQGVIEREGDDYWFRAGFW